MAVARNRTHRPVPALLVVILGEAATAAFELGVQRAPARFGVETGGLGEGDALLAAKREGALPNQKHMSRVFHYRARCQNGIARSENGGYRTCAKIAAVHYCSIHFLSAGSREDAAPSCVEKRIIFEHHHGLGHGIKRTPAIHEDIATGCQRAVQSLMVRRRASCRRLVAMDRSGATMNR